MTRPSRFARVLRSKASLLALSTAACAAPACGRASRGAPSELGVVAGHGRASAGEGAPSASSNRMIFLLIGQSNMVGAPSPEASDQVENPNVQVLAYEDCANLGRAYNHWYVAKPPLHGCNGGVGPGDHFGRALAKAYPDATIGLVPLAINGVDIDFFVKGAVSVRRAEFRIPPDNHWPGAYEWVLERARLAQRSGTIRGIAFHQGESDTGSPQWLGKVKTLVSDLRTDLGLGEAPFVAGELLYSGCCGKWHNPLLLGLPQAISNAKVVSAAGLSGQDDAHFDLAGQRELGARYGAAMLELLKASP
jgi:hypothetical protein